MSELYEGSLFRAALFLQEGDPWNLMPCEWNFLTRCSLYNPRYGSETDG